MSGFSRTVSLLWQNPPMKKLVLILLAAACASCGPQATATKAPNGASDADLAAWDLQARNVTIIRDDWGLLTSSVRRTPMRCSA